MVTNLGTFKTKVIIYWQKTCKTKMTHFYISNGGVYFFSGLSYWDWTQIFPREDKRQVLAGVTVHETATRHEIHTCKGVGDVIFDHDVDEHSWENQRLIFLVPQADVTVTWRRHRMDTSRRLERGVGVQMSGGVHASHLPFTGNISGRNCQQFYFKWCMTFFKAGTCCTALFFS